MSRDREAELTAHVEQLTHENTHLKASIRKMEEAHTLANLSASAANKPPKKKAATKPARAKPSKPRKNTRKLRIEALEKEEAILDSENDRVKASVAAMKAFMIEHGMELPHIDGESDDNDGNGDVGNNVVYDNGGGNHGVYDNNGGSNVVYDNGDGNDGNIDVGNIDMSNNGGGTYDINDYLLNTPYPASYNHAHQY